MVPHPAWCSPFTAKSSHHPSATGASLGVTHPVPSTSGLPSHSSPYLFSFPPTPPKDATPDNVTSAGSANLDFCGGVTGIGTADEKGSVAGMISTLGSALSSCPREGSTGFSTSFSPVHQTAHSMPTYPAYVPGPHLTGPPPPADISNASYGFHVPSQFFSPKTSQSSKVPTVPTSGSKPRTKGRCSKGKKLSPAGVSPHLVVY
ncbi:GATA-binding factor 2-like [Limulus polyphemus]|uniref:GATA-binding factor 2-like n=1 Tax=Limulus polyphemus TaxID=6850 RepID=A0ABM1C2K1_LIMPO|nr:GATA-binding factor 2-like [Limulus polyphemus]